MPQLPSYNGVHTIKIPLVDEDPLKNSKDKTVSTHNDETKLGSHTMFYSSDLSNIINRSDTFKLEKDSAYLVLITVYNKPIGAPNIEENISASE